MHFILKISLVVAQLFQAINSAAQSNTTRLVYNSFEQDYTTERTSIKIKVVYAVGGPEETVEAFNELIDSTFLRKTPYWMSTRTTIPKFKQPARFADFIAKQWFADAKKQAEEDDFFECISKISIVRDVPTYVSIGSVFFAGTGHGTGYVSEKIIYFSKKTREIVEPFTEEAERAMQPLLRKHAAEALEVDDKELNEWLWNSETGYVNLPKSIRFTGQEVVFSYAWREVFLPGIEGCVFSIPYSEIRKFMTPEVQKFFLEESR